MHVQYVRTIHSLYSNAIFETARVCGWGGGGGGDEKGYIWKLKKNSKYAVFVSVPYFF